MWCGVCLYVVVLALATARASCPPQLRAACTCGAAHGRDQYTCRAAGAAFLLSASYNQDAEIHCSKGVLNTAELPSFPVSPNQTLNMVFVAECAVAGALRDVVRALGAPGAMRVRVAGARPLATAQLRALDRTEVLIVDNAPDSIQSLAALTSLPALVDLRVHGGVLQLDAGEEEGARPLQHLELIDAGVARLPPGALGTFPRLRTLTVSSNPLEHLENGSFRGLDQLEELNLNRNALREVRAGALAGARRLRVLRLTKPRLRALGTGALAGLTKLEKVTILIGEEPLTVGARALAALPALREVLVGRTRLAPLPADLLAGSAALRVLALMRCNLTALPPGLLTDQVNLVSLDLSGNALQELASGQFQTLRRLQDLNLSDNLLEKLPEHIFASLRDLESIRLDGNRLVSFARKTFNGLGALRLLSLADNRLTLRASDAGAPDADGPSDFLKSPFAYLNELRTLNLTRNSISAIFDDWRISWLQIEHIDLSWNKITRLEAKDTSFSAKVTVDLRHNEISSVEPAGASRATLLLGRNPLRCDCALYALVAAVARNSPNYDVETAFCASPQHLKNTSLTTISNDMSILTCPVNKTCPQNCLCLRRPASSSLDVSCPDPPHEYPDPAAFNLTVTTLRLRSAPSHLDLPSHVQTLNLSDANLLEIPHFPDSVKELDLRNNSLEVIPEWIWQKNIRMYLPKNSLICSCSTKDSLRRVNEYLYTRIYNSEELFCADGRRLGQVDVASLCDVFVANVIGGSLVLFSALAFVVAAVLYRKDQAIKRYLYSRGWLFFVTEEEIDKKLYDILLSYPDNYEKFVAQEFVPILEDEEYSVCVRYRDWEAGDWIPGKVAQLVEASRRTVVLLSREYLTAISSLELSAALMAERRERWKRVVIVLLEDIEGDEELKALLADVKYLVMGDDSFWRQLRLRLPRRRARRPVSERLRQTTRNLVLNWRQEAALKKVYEPI